jgi:Protein of unknown function (DUF3102)
MIDLPDSDIKTPALALPDLAEAIEAEHHRGNLVAGRPAMSSNRLPVLAAEIRKAHADVQEAAKTAAEHAITAGHALIEAKSLVKHGEWLPWLREHCALAERTAQLYMRIAASGLKTATVADLGLQAAAKALTIYLPDPFGETPEEELQEWRLFALFLMEGGGWRNRNAYHHCEWLKRNGWTSPNEWMGEEGDRFRKRVGYRRPMPMKTKAAWFAFLAERCDWQKEAIESAVVRLTEAEPQDEPYVDGGGKPRRRRRRARA